MRQHAETDCWAVLIGWCQASRHQLGVGQVLAFIVFLGWLHLISFGNHVL
jgi:hypothetical protein